MGKEARKKYDPNGGEICDGTPLSPPLGYQRKPSLAEQIRQQIIAAKLDALQELAESEDEADDFEIGDDWDPTSPHENEGAPTIKELRERVDMINDEIKRQQLQKLRETVDREIELKNAPLPNKNKKQSTDPVVASTDNPPE